MTESTIHQERSYLGRQPDGRCLRVGVADGLIARVEEMPADEGLPYLLPVLVDLQHNGALGYAFSSIGQHGIEAMRAIAGFMRRHGVGRCLPTLTTHPIEELRKSAACVNEWLNADADLSLLFAGLFHEGVYISPQDGWRGVHPRQWIRPPDWETLRELDELSGRRIRMVNVAPEEPGGLDFVAQAAAAGMLVAIGHCCPDAATVHAAAARGASLVTHFGNGASPTLHRFKNPFWAMLNEPALRFGMIGDGFHLPPDLVGAALTCKGRDGCFMVSDAAFLSGCPPGRYDHVDSVDCVVEANGHLHVADGELLAGAWFQLDRSVEFLVETQGLALPEAWRLCSTLPAEIIGEELPALAEGEEASFVLARWDEGLVIEQSVHGGKAYLSDAIRPTDCGRNS